MKLDLTKILLIAALIFIGWQGFFKGSPDPVPKPITITIPEVTGSSGIIKLDTVTLIDTVYLKGKTVQVDKGYKELYEQTKDSLKKKELYLEAIKINKYEGVVVDNEDITIEGKATTRGNLLDYSVDYTIKKKDIAYTPEVVTKLPDLSVGIGLEIGVPLLIQNNYAAKANLSFMNKKGKIINVGYDTNKTVWVGFTKIFKLKK